MPSAFRSRPTIRASTLALLAILALGFTIRMVGIDWDQGRYLHPDERHIVADVLVDRVELSWPPSTSWLDPDESPINPRPGTDGEYAEFAYGTFPVYAVDAIGSIAEEITGVDWNGYQRAAYIGRAVSVLLDTGTILLTYLTASLLFGRLAGLVGAAIYAFAPIAIQASHFFTVDSWMTFFIFASLYTAMRAVDRAAVWQFPLAAIWFALALASKTTAAPVAGILALALLLASVADSGHGMAAARVAIRFGIRAASSIAAFAVVYFIGEPFAFLQPQALAASLRTQADIQSGAWDVPFTQQYVGTVRFSYHLEQAVRYHLGPVLTLLGIVGAAALGWMIWRTGSRSALLLGTWIGGFAIVILWPETKFPRYVLPIVPSLAATAGFAIAAIAVWLRTVSRRAISVGFIAAMVLLSSAYGAAFASVTTDDHTRLVASVWMAENLPPGSRVIHEIWDDRLPFSVSPGHANDARRIDATSINLYSTAPTFGDIAELAPAVEQLPGGSEIAASLLAGRVDDATAELKSLGPLALTAPSVSENVRRSVAEAQGAPAVGEQRATISAAAFRASLLRAADSMTSSPHLSTAVRRLADTVRATGEVTPDNIGTLAAIIEAARDSSMAYQTYQLLDNADYYVLASDRVQRGMEQNPWRYQVPIRMYELLESGAIGYDEVASFSSYPELFGMSFPDATADETFINYDHPVVEIFARDDLVSFQDYVEALGSAALAQADPNRSPEPEPLTFETPVSDFPDLFDARWSEALTGNSWGAAIVWVAMLVLLQVAAWPLARAVFRSFPDAGWGLTRTVGLIVPATVLWILASTEILLFRAVWVVAAVALFALASWLWFSRVRLSVDRPMVGAAEVVFWLTFGIFLVFKLINPDSWHFWWGGEKPMEFAQINAVLRSPTFPPVDPWYAQGFINYYYYSFYLVAFLIKLTGIPTEYAFNLAQPTVMALLAAGTFSVGAMLASRLWRARQSALLGGVLAVLVVSFAGNMRSVALVLEQLRGEDDVISPFVHWVWTPSRTILDNDAQLITEFPYFAGLYGDLHSHVVGMVLVVMTVSLGLSFVFDSATARPPLDRQRLAWLLVSIVTLGIIYPTNAWDLPVSAALIGASVLIGTSSAWSIGARIRSVAGTLALLGVGAFLVALPFTLHFEALFGSLESARNTTELVELWSHLGGLILLATLTVPALIQQVSGRPLVAPVIPVGALLIALLARWLATDRWPDAVAVLDILTVLIVVTIWLLALPWRRLRERTLDFGLPGVTLPVIVFAGVAAVIGLVLGDRLVAALYIGIGTAATAAFLLRRPPVVRFAALLVAGAAFIGAGIEFVFLVDDLANSDWARMNTVFKFSNQIWLLLGIAGGASSGVLLASLLERLALASPSRPSVFGRQWPMIASVGAAIVLFLASVFPITATAPRLETRFEPRPIGPTLDAYAWMEFGTVGSADGTEITFDEDLDVIEWFNEEVGGTPVIAEAAFGPYRCNSSRISNATGLPSVLGWQRHQLQQRYGDVLPQREEDLRRLYA
ncbi:MAG: DUF2298 domain-containing protein, partial [Chloroflexota bacterium]|nr:DUF2298 domain-containing protein [Chloroflexota bacterium]